VKVAGLSAIATSLARSMGSTRQTSQINESIKINDNLNSFAQIAGLNFQLRDLIFRQRFNRIMHIEQEFCNSYNFCNYFGISGFIIKIYENVCIGLCEIDLYNNACYKERENMTLRD